MTTATEPRRVALTSQTSGEHEGASFLWLAAVLLRGRKVLWRTATVGLLLGVTVALFQRPLYTSSFSFLPQANQDAARAAGLAGLAGQFGINLGNIGNSEPPQLYADLVTTRGVLTPIAVDSFSPAPNARPERLATLLQVRGSDSALVLDKTLRKLRRDVISTTVALRTTGMITVNVRTQSPQVSLAIAQRLLTGLNAFNLVTRQSQARAERKFAEGRYAQAMTELRQGEDVLQRFLTSNRQYQNSPQLTFEKDRLQRDVTLHQQVVTTLAQQLEDARIREVRDTPVISVIEEPTLAAKPDSRGRILIVALGVIGGLALGVLIVLIADAWRRERALGRDPALAVLRNEWLSLRRRSTT
ncbi:MAG TPA: GNVR domain-containing protein [Gemmatimonadaceae bacterium]|nr:GNVR domain-containing protein [Gemmatimonadaceae bacterium]